MADDRRIIIELKVSGSSDGDSKKREKESNNLVDFLQKAQNPLGTLEKSIINEATLGKTEMVNYMWQQTKALAKNAIFYTVHKYYNLTENYKAEQDLNNTLSVISHVGEAYTSILGGAIAGAKAGGGWGAAIGAVAGATFWIGNTAIDAVKAWDQEGIQLNTMRIQSGYQKARLGLIDDGRGTQN